MKVHWIEPGKYRRARFQKWSVRDSVLYGLLIFGVLAGLRALGDLSPRPDRHPPAWPTFLFWSFVGAFVVALSWPRILPLLSASNVIFSEKGVNNNLQVGTRVNIRFWAWDKIAAVQVWRDPQAVVSLIGPSGERLETFALSARVDITTLKVLVEAHGKRFENTG